MADSIFKTFGPHKLDNVNIKGMLEYKFKPWEMIVEITTKVTPNPEARDSFRSIAECREWLVREHIGQAILAENINAQLPAGWDTDRWMGFGYSYDHSPKQFRYGNKSAFNITLHLNAPDRDSWRDLQDDFTNIAQSISKTSNFTTNDFVKFEGK